MADRRQPTSATVLLLCVALSASCGYTIVQDHDHVLGRTVTRMSRNVVGGLAVFGTTLVVNAAKIEDRTGVSYGLWVQTLSSNWILPSGLMMRIDTIVVDFGPGSRLSADVDCSGGGCQHDERYFYPATADHLRQLAAAKQVIVRLAGQNGYIEKDFSPENIANFRDFVHKEVH